MYNPGLPAGHITYDRLGNAHVNEYPIIRENFNLWAKDDYRDCFGDERLKFEFRDWKYYASIGKITTGKLLFS